MRRVGSCFMIIVMALMRYCLRSVFSFDGFVFIWVLGTYFVALLTSVTRFCTASKRHFASWKQQIPQTIHTLAFCTVLLVNVIFVVLPCERLEKKFPVVKRCLRVLPWVVFILFGVTTVLAQFLACKFVWIDTTRLLTQDIVTNDYGAIDSLQEYFRCCGVNGPKDWLWNEDFSCHSGVGVCGVPSSCCVNQSNETCGDNIWRNDTGDLSYLFDAGDLPLSIWTTGCVDRCKWINISYIVGLFVYQIVMICMYFTVFKFGQRCLLTFANDICYFSCWCRHSWRCYSRKSSEGDALDRLIVNDGADDDDSNYEMLSCTYLCEFCSSAMPLINYIRGEKVILCTLFGYQLSSRTNKWRLVVYLYDLCPQLTKDIYKIETGKGSNRSLFDGPNSVVIDQQDRICVEVNEEIWKSHKPMQVIRARDLWKKWSGNKRSLEFDVFLKSGVSTHDTYCTIVIYTRFSICILYTTAQMLDKCKRSVHAVFGDKIFQSLDIKYNPNEDFVGAGGFADVYKAVLSQTGKVVAFKKPRIHGGRFTAKEWVRESSILLSIPQHDYIVDVFGICIDPYNYGFVLEYIDSDLDELLRSRHSSDPYIEQWCNRLDMACQIADGMKHLHGLESPVIHRDLKPNNVLVKKSPAKYICKITDFGLATIQAATFRTTKKSGSKSGSFQPAGCLGFVPPERYRLDHLNMAALAKSDVYSFGVILWQFRERKQPFGDENNDDVIAINVKEGTPYMVPRCPCPDGYDELTKCCCSFKLVDRPVFTDILNDLQKIDHHTCTPV